MINPHRHKAKFTPSVQRYSPASAWAVLAWSMALVLILSGCSLVLPDAPAPSPTPEAGEPTAAQRYWIMPTSEPADDVAAHASTIRYVDGVTVSLWAGSGLRGGTDGPGREAQFDGPVALALDPEGYLLVAEYDSGRIRLIDKDRFVRSWIGDSSSKEGIAAPLLGPFDHPTDLAVSPDNGDVYLVDGQDRLMVIRDRARLDVLAGGSRGFRDGAAGQAAFRHLQGLALGPGGIVYLSDGGNHRLRLYDAAGQVFTLVGSGLPGYQDGPAPQAQMNWPYALAVDEKGQLYVGDGGGLGESAAELQASIRRLESDGQTVTVAGGQTQGYHDGDALAARFRRPLAGMDMDDHGNLYIADTSNHAIRVLTTEGQVLTVAGNGTYGMREGSGAECMLGLPVDVLWDGESGLWVADYGQQVIWHMALAGTLLTTD